MSRYPSAGGRCTDSERNGRHAIGVARTPCRLTHPHRCSILSTARRTGTGVPAILRLPSVEAVARQSEHPVHRLEEVLKRPTGHQRFDGEGRPFI